MRCVIIAFFLTFASFAQTESISIIQYTASFAEQVTLEDYKEELSGLQNISVTDLPPIDFENP